ncbi:MAG: LuxR C-terminal-related transcriptional regulator [Anaerolineae bacterium]
MNVSSARLPIVATKLYRGAEGANIVRRGRLLGVLNRALNYPLTLIIAPAGYGKTTLLQGWLAELDCASAMVALDAHDSSVGAFLTCMVSAVQSELPNALSATTDLLVAPSFPPMSEIFRTLISELNAIRDTVVVVLDDFDQINDADTLGLVQDIARYAPPSLHLVITGRIEPDLVLARLRAQGQVLDIGVADLRFSADETEALIAQVTHNSLEPATTEWLMTYTDGWVTGLRLMLSSLERAPQALLRLSSSPLLTGHVLDYLSQEVFTSFTPFEQDFLIRTSILNAVSLPLARFTLQLTDLAAGQSLLQRMWRDSSFVTALDEGATWFSYHPLLREFLAAQLHTRYTAEAIADLHQRASQWLADDGQLDESFAHARANSEQSAADFVVAQRERLYDADDWDRLGRWLRQLPEPLILCRPELVLAQGHLSYRLGRLREVRSCIELAESLLVNQPEYPRVRELSGEVMVLRGMLAGWNIGSAELVTLATRALSYLDDTSSSFVKTTASLILASGYQTAGHHGQAFDLLLTLLHDSHARSSSQTKHILHVLCLGYWQFGQAAELWAIAQRMLEQGERAHRRDWESLAHFFMGCARYDLDDLAGASWHFRAVLDHPFQVETVYLVQSACGLAFIHTVFGQHAEAEAVIQQAWSTLLEAGNTEWIAVLQSLRLELVLRRGLLPAENWTGQPVVRQVVGTARGLYEPVLTGVRLLLQKRDADSLGQAVTLLAGIQRTAERFNRRRAIIQTLILQALVFEAQGARHAALKQLAKAVRLVEQGGEIRLILDFAPAITPLLGRLASQDIAPEFIHQLLRALNSVPYPSDGDALTERELQVLRMVAAGLSNQEIAERLVLSTGTVKQHLHRVYRKLGVSSRTEALREARRRRLALENG